MGNANPLITSQAYRYVNWLRCLECLHFKWYFYSPVSLKFAPSPNKHLPRLAKGHYFSHHPAEKSTPRHVLATLGFNFGKLRNSKT